MTIMAYVDKARVEGTLYDISPSPTGNLDSTSENAYTSSDVAQANATTWTNVNPILATEQHRSIFSKLTSMIKNIRYLYNIVGSGTFAPGNGTTVTDVVNNKAPKSHTHTAAQLPTSNSQINSTSYVPTSALIYSMNQTLNSLNDAIDEVEDNIPSQNSILINYNYDPSNTLIATFNSLTDTNNFCNTYNHSNNYNGLKLGQRIQINDGTYNKAWYIAGFDCEYNNVASDCTIKNNGYGICLVPTTSLISAQWNPTNTTSRGYYGSSIHNLCNTTIGPNLKYILGSHLITRNVLITNSVTNNGSSVNYIWRTANCILLNRVSIEGTYLTSDSKVKYNTGELSYQLPIFRFISRYFLNGTWLREVSDSAGSTHADYVGSYASITNDLTSSIHSVFPLIYIR